MRPARSSTLRTAQAAHWPIRMCMGSVSPGGYAQWRRSNSAKAETVADAKLRPIFDGAAKATMFEVPKHLNRHLA
jgi:hypothetical protein